MRSVTRYATVALIAFLAALAALWVSHTLPGRESESAGGFHALMHERLHLDKDQAAAIDELEARFARRRTDLNGQLHKANVELAEAVASEHEYGPKVEHAVDLSHLAMGELQKATLQHVFAMRAVLRPDQAQTFDQVVADALTKSPQD